MKKYGSNTITILLFKNYNIKKNQAMLKLYYFMPVFIISLFLSKLKHKTKITIFGFFWIQSE